jgi:hypothetical protein
MKCDGMTLFHEVWDVAELSRGGEVDGRIEYCLEGT